VQKKGRPFLILSSLQILMNKFSLPTFTFEQGAGG